MKINSVVTEINITIDDNERDALIRYLTNDKIKAWNFHERAILLNIAKQLLLTKGEQNETSNK